MKRSPRSVAFVRVATAPGLWFWFGILPLGIAVVFALKVIV